MVHAVLLCCEREGRRKRALVDESFREGRAAFYLDMALRSCSGLPNESLGWKKQTVQLYNGQGTHRNMLAHGGFPRERPYSGIRGG